MSIPMKYPMKQYLGGIVEALKAAPGNDANPNDVETIRFYGELGNDVPDSQLPNVLVAIARVTRAASEEASTKSKFAAANGFAYVRDAQTAIMATLDKASEELVEKRG
ncbi:hypothetical protein [Bifidobacterium vespertilionis]|uniref:Uncharacterized protein n=1 Tax=Bifidobacterium vespertilionis TaxID=2562524 RepID=A0A5J5DTX5_9BIFI|nr:hypothetical protein [Bifidobacterium vespertilionis]KAA8819037.1 hypothetical protein EMO90_08800 [Bifidobacterium vespertilionis]KAA8822155.1 hypothetical protein EM848_09470 [Bifidobacterium vespertilionis]MBT1180309.1 hypothetical protein [Bifidobacterium vespertilionis]